MNVPSAEREGALIALGDPSIGTVPPSVLDAHGGFAWWYVDTIDAQGNGAVIIWAFGLPFLPGYLSGARHGRGVPARARPSLNIALYRGGRRAFYLLQEYGERGAEMDGAGGFRFGDSRMDCPEPGRVRLRLDCPLPRTSVRLRGELELRGAPARLAPSLAPSPDVEHRWAPVLGPAWAEGLFEAGAERYPIAGPAYHDRNEGARRFDDLGIAYWTWGRLATSSRTAIWYLCYAKNGPPTAWGAEIDAKGTLRLIDGLEPRLEGPRRGAFGLRTFERLHLRAPDGSDWLRARTGPRVDDGPFYARTLAEVEAGGDRGVGLGEWIVPDRIDLGRHRPLVRMAVHDLSGRSSFWVPLFSGPRSGRLARLLGLPLAERVRAASGDTP